MSEANAKQVDGTHYQTKSDRQHWDEMWDVGEEEGQGWLWFYGCITKYVRRYRKKNGLRDLLKARHYLDKLIELETERYGREAVPGSGPPDDGQPERHLRPNMFNRTEGDSA